MNLGKQLENAPKNLVLYVLGLVGAVVDDYTLVTLTIFCVLLGFILDAVLIPAAVFFGLYFVLRLVNALADTGYRLAQATFEGSRTEAQSTMQVAAALAQFRPPVQQEEAPPGFELHKVPVDEPVVVRETSP